jgi:hypothetical protein
MDFPKPGCSQEKVQGQWKHTSPCGKTLSGRKQMYSNTPVIFIATRNKKRIRKIGSHENLLMRLDYF